MFANVNMLSVTWHYFVAYKTLSQTNSLKSWTPFTLVKIGNQNGCHPFQE